MVYLPNPDNWNSNKNYKHMYIYFMLHLSLSIALVFISDVNKVKNITLTTVNSKHDVSPTICTYVITSDSSTRKYSTSTPNNKPVSSFDNVSTYQSIQDRDNFSVSDTLTKYID